MKPLYELAAGLNEINEAMEEHAAENDGDITNFPLLAEMQDMEGEIKTKCLKIGVWVKSIKAEEVMLATEIKSLQRRKATAKNKAERLTAYLTDHVPSESAYQDSRCKFGWRKTNRVQVNCDAEDLPVEYRNIVTTPNKVTLKEHLKSGGQVENVILLYENKLQIK